jgi:predicted metal-binding membrane protein
MGGMSAQASPGPLARRDPVIIAVVLLVAAAAWAATLILARGMAAMPGTMELASPAFLGVWLLMMVAMMLPAVAPVARMYTRTMPPPRAVRVTVFLCGYLLVWAAAGLPAFALAWGAGTLAANEPMAARISAVATFLAVAAYQVSPLKDVCLRACRSPLGLLLRYVGYSGRLRDLRVGAHHGLYCLGCCWALFAALIALGLMNVLAMVALAGALTAEKLWSHGVGLSRVLASAAVGVALLVAVHPELATGLYSVPMSSGM